MEPILKLFETHTQFGTMLHIAVDVLILVLLTVILVLRGPRISKKDEVLMRSLEKIVEETATISQGLESNLGKRQELLQQITAQLDQRIQAAQNLCTRLGQLTRATGENPAQNTENLPTAGPRSQNADQQKVLALARKGLNAAEIAKNLKRPVGEVELILDLKRIAN
jgi:hypothetical protein